MTTTARTLAACHANASRKSDALNESPASRAARKANATRRALRIVASRAARKAWDTRDAMAF